MASDFFNLKGLETRTGLSSWNWDTTIIKELIDNALDAVEGNEQKKVTIQYENESLKIFDNGSGLSFENIKTIYNFENYVSRNRHIITPSRGKQGNGLKSIIGICYVREHQLIWHTSDGIKLKVVVDAEMVEDGDLKVEFIKVGQTDCLGIEIQNITLSKNSLNNKVWRYAQCNPDVNFDLYIQYEHYPCKATKQPINKSKETSLAFYSFREFKRLISLHPTATYKSVLGEYFSTREKNKSKIKAKVDSLNYDEVELDFYDLKSTLNTKPNTLLRKHIVGFGETLEVSVYPDNNTSESIPCLVEFSVAKAENQKDESEINCYINNSITYYNGRSIEFSERFCKIGTNRNPVGANNLSGLLEFYKGYEFNIHIISPYLKFTDYGKTTVDISDFVDQLVDELRKAISKASKKYPVEKSRKQTDKVLAKKYMTQAFLIASSNARYSITARQMWYKLRELIGRGDPLWEGRQKNPYDSFTQNWLTEWLEENEQYESQVNFSERGNYYANGTQTGLGSASVRSFINNINSKADIFEVYGGLQDKVYIDDKNFNVRYKYDKVLYIEKTGFDNVFRAESLEEKYNLLIISGQGFASRSARLLMYQLQQQGMQLFCMHDLDLSGVDIFNSMCQANNKFKYNLDIVNLGITPEDVKKYNIEPEYVPYQVDEKILSKLDYDHRIFFDKGSHSQRVEINAFSTEQLLELIDNKLGSISNLPKVNISQSLKLDNVALREVAFMRIMRERYKSLLDEVELTCDLSMYDGDLTLFEAKKKIPEIAEEIVKQFEKELLSRIAT